MTPTTPPEMAQALQALAQSDALQTLESLLAKQNAFNLFDAIGVSNQELRHSDFLAFLLRPHEAHGLGDAFLKWFLHHALAHSPAPPVAPADLDKWDLSDANVGREPDNIDLFITSASNRLAVIIENKIRTGEHSDQLSRYMETAKAQGHGGSGGTLLGVYLTPHGGKSSHADYLPIGYEAVCAHLERLCQTNAFSKAASPDVETTVRHYTRMLRRKIVGDPEIAKLCRELYADHQKAVDRIFEEVRNKYEQTHITSSVDEVIANTPGFVLIQAMKYKDVNYSSFTPASWADEAGLKLFNQSSKHLRCIYLQVETHLNGYQEISGIIKLADHNIGQQMVRLINESGWLTFVQHPTASGKYRCFYRFPLMKSGDPSFTKAWQEWVENEGPKFAALIKPGDFPAA